MVCAIRPESCGRTSAGTPACGTGESGARPGQAGQGMPVRPGHGLMLIPGRQFSRGNGAREPEWREPRATCRLRARASRPFSALQCAEPASLGRVANGGNKAGCRQDTGKMPALGRRAARLAQRVSFQRVVVVRPGSRGPTKSIDYWSHPDAESHPEWSRRVLPWAEISASMLAGGVSTARVQPELRTKRG